MYINRCRDFDYGNIKIETIYFMLKIAYCYVMPIKENEVPLKYIILELFIKADNFCEKLRRNCQLFFVIWEVCLRVKALTGLRYIKYFRLYAERLLPNENVFMIAYGYSF